jgi:hypothetical protein
MNALTLWQPWASLMMGGFKTIETRPWATSHRGWLAIHAAKQEPKHVKARFAGSSPEYRREISRLFWECLHTMGYHQFHELPRGAILGVVYVTNTLPTKKLRQSVDQYNRAFGDWTDGRFAWIISHGLRFLDPVPARGRQRLWDWEVPTELTVTQDGSHIWNPTLTEPIPRIQKGDPCTINLTNTATTTR